MRFEPINVIKEYLTPEKQENLELRSPYISGQNEDLMLLFCFSRLLHESVDEDLQKFPPPLTFRCQVYPVHVRRFVFSQPGMSFSVSQSALPA